MTGSGQTVHMGRGVCRKLGPILKQQSPRKIFLVTGKASYALSGAEAAVGPAVAQCEMVRFSDFGSNLKSEEIVNGVEVFREHKCDYVIGVGGGSVIDLAKAVSMLGPQADDPEGYIAEPLVPPAPRVRSIMIPTTAGTGAESTHFSVIYVGGLKRSLSHLPMLADYALVDPNLTDSLPREVTAGSGMDALCQAIESFWSNRSTDASRRLSARAVGLALANIARAVNDPDPFVRDNMLLAANLSGQAINQARTTVAHAASYPLTSRFGITHGHAVALLMPGLFEFNADVTEATVQDARGIAFVRRIMRDLFEILGVGGADEAREKFLQLMAEVHLESRLSRVGLERDDLEAVVLEAISSNRAGNNPRQVDEKCLMSLYQAVF